MAMLPLTPKLASEAALYAYVTQTAAADKIHENVPLIAARKFDFQGGLVSGISGTVIDRMFDRRTGFAVIGQGRPNTPYDGHHIVAIRGTATLKDAVTDAHCGVTNAPNNHPCHAGFFRTFDSMAGTLEKYFLAAKRKTGGLKVHCVGHSLGGALANLTANMLTQPPYSAEVNLYTFGSPRVGVAAYPGATESATKKIYRSTNGSDPVALVPVWPFRHAGSELCLDGACLINPMAHKMTRYIQNAAVYQDYGQISNYGAALDPAPLRLKEQDRHQVQCSALWEKRLFRALRTYIMDAGLSRLQVGFSAALTFYDVLAKEMEETAKASDTLAAQQRGLLACMLSFVGKSAMAVGELTYRFIRSVFQMVLDKLASLAKTALGMLSD
ncbi:lipase family protein [Corallincola holothuriorum]|uniref:Lipase family protein n=1 Tax=Corallincola holothuriorum TaxID=2282215 RepID=A0A368NKC1_9GAMM|nr:lipase family protein [Corallincola holothuriorum]RCU50898.1 lipase family protein [Corallincola holothuriorum]